MSGRNSSRLLAVNVPEEIYERGSVSQNVLFNNENEEGEDMTVEKAAPVKKDLLLEEEAQMVKRYWRKTIRFRFAMVAKPYVVFFFFFFMKVARLYREQGV